MGVCVLSTGIILSGKPLLRVSCKIVSGEKQQRVVLTTMCGSQQLIHRYPGPVVR